jgi:hypothetical protein
LAIFEVVSKLADSDNSKAGVGYTNRKEEVDDIHEDQDQVAHPGVVVAV